MYPGAQGNSRFAGKRFWTDCLYSYTHTGYEQAGWMKEEPLAFDARECQTAWLLTGSSRDSHRAHSFICSHKNASLG